MADLPPDVRRPQDHRAHLLAVARLILADNRRFGAKFDASDAVQAALAKAIQAKDQFRGQSSEDYWHWLVHILRSQIGQEIRKYQTDKRNVDLEVRIEESSARIERFVAHDQSTPSEQLEKLQAMARLLDAVEQLPAELRAVIVGRYYDDKTPRQLADETQRDPKEIAALLRRAQAELKRLLNHRDTEAQRRQ